MATSSAPVSRPRLRTLHKMAEVLALFMPTRPAWRLNEIAAELAWDTATAHRLLQTLVDIRLLERIDGERYQLGVRTLELAAVYLSTDPHRRALLARVDSIAERSGITTQLAVLDGTSVTIVASREGTNALKAAAMLGERLPIHATAAGKAILAQLTDEKIAKLLPRRLELFTDRTLTTRDELLEQVRAARVTGMARVEEELSRGLYAVAVPVSRDEFRSGVAALTCVGPPTTILPSQWAVAEQELRAHLPGSGRHRDTRAEVLS